MKVIQFFETAEEKGRKIKECIDNLVNDIERMEARNKDLMVELERPADEKLEIAYAEIKELAAENQKLRRNSLYSFSDEEVERKREIWKKHRDSGCNRRNYHYEVVGTGIGSVVTHVCSCGYREVVADDIS